MDGLHAFILWTVFVGALGFAGGKYPHQQELSQGCTNKGEMVIHDKVFACKPTHALVDGRRIKLEQ